MKVRYGLLWSQIWISVPAPPRTLCVTLDPVWAQFFICNIEVINTFKPVSKIRWHKNYNMCLTKGGTPQPSKGDREPNRSQSNHILRILMDQPFHLSCPRIPSIHSLGPILHPSLASSVHQVISFSTTSPALPSLSCGWVWPMKGPKGDETMLPVPPPYHP